MMQSMQANTQPISESTLNSVSLNVSKLEENPPLDNDSNSQPSSGKLILNNFEVDYTEKPHSQQGHTAQPRYISSSRPQNNPPDFFEPESTAFANEGQTTSGLSPTFLSIIAYFFGWIGGFVVLILEKKNLFVTFHAWQSLSCGIIAFVIQMIFVWSKTMETLLWIAYLCFTFFMIFQVIKTSASHSLYKVPILGEWSEAKALNKIQMFSTNNSYRQL